ncbi:MAG: ABC transporter permease [Vicinamibacterales bacterium]
MPRLSSLWRNLVHRDRVDLELDDEMRAIFNLLVDEKVQAGMPLEHARRAAKLELGGVEPVKQRVREQRSGAYVEAFFKDVSYGLRMLRSNVGFTVVVVLSLAAGIGANSAIFSVANALMLRTLPVPDAGRLYTVRPQSRLPTTARYSYPFIQDLQKGFPAAAGVAGMSRVTRARTQISDGAEPETSSLQLVSGEFFPVLGLRPELGRFLTADDNRTLGGHPLAVISHAFWHRRFGGTPDVLNRTVTFNGSRFTIVGVAPEGFSGVWLESPVDAWVPLMMQADVRYMGNFSASNADINLPWTPQDNIRWLEIILRADRADGPEAAAINAVFGPKVLSAAEAVSDPKERSLFLDQRLVLEPFAHGSSNLRDRFRAPLFALMGMVALLLLIACANTANLLLARGTSRRHEMALRLSLGASRFRVVSQLLTESVLLGVLAAGVGLAIAPLASEMLVRMTIGVESGPLPFPVGIDRNVLAFTAVLALATSLLFGIAPAWRTTDMSLGSTLKTGGRGSTGGRRTRLASLLVVSQVALSLLLVVGAGLFLRSFQNLSELPLGFDAEHVVSASINPRSAGYREDELPALYRRIVARVETLPGVQSATISICGLMAGCRSSSSGLFVSGYQSQPGEEVAVQEFHVGPGYFRTVGMQLMAGRDFDERDLGTPGTVAIVNEAMAHRYFKDREAVGQKFGYDKPDLEIVGVVRDARVNTVREAAVPMAFYPMNQKYFAGVLDVRTTGDPGALAAALRKVIADVEPRLPVDRVTTVADLAGSTLRQERLVSRLTTLVSVLALALACLGLYGLLSYGVKQRTAELGLRLALGAPRSQVLWMVFRESLMLTGIGLAIGLPVVLGASRLVGTLLFEVSPNDPATLSVATLLLIAVGAWAGYLPAWRASRVDPLTALRHE